MTSLLTDSNRVNVPAVCRLRDPVTEKTVGSGVYVAPGLLLTSSAAIPTQSRAARVVATFFEGTKKRPLDVHLQPQRYYFASRYPPEMDYCLVACEEAPLFNVTPVKIPLTAKGWTPVEEGDVLLIIEHPFNDAAAAEGDPGISAAPAAAATLADRKRNSSNGTMTDGKSTFDNSSTPYVEQKRFEEVLRCRNHLCYLKSNGNCLTTGCPAFNESGHLVGLQSQSRADGEGVVNRVLSLISIVKHLFANAQLPHLPQDEVTFEDAWDTWYIVNDISRIVAILANFKGVTMAQQVTRRLCDLTAKPELVNSISDNGGITVILQNLRTFHKDESLAEAGLRALWNVSIGDDAHLAKICEMDGAAVILDVVEPCSGNETVLQLCSVLLHNIAGCRASPDFSKDLGARALAILYPGFQKHRESVVLQKFSLSFFATLVRLNEGFARTLAEQRIVEHIIHLIEEMPKQIFLMEMVVDFIAELAQYPKTVEIICGGAAQYGPMNITYLIDLLIHLIFEYRELDSLLVNGNRALWGLGNVPTCRAVILENARGTDALRISLPALITSTHR